MPLFLDTCLNTDITLAIQNVLYGVRWQEIVGNLKSEEKGDVSAREAHGTL